MKQFEFTTLKLFLAVADCGSLTTAADKCNIAIAALSKRISDLEAAADTRFFERRARGMSLTPAGHRRNAPALGADTQAVLEEIGLSAGQIAALQERGIVG